MKTNEEIFMDQLQLIDPELYNIKIALLTTDVNPDIIPAVIRTIGNLTLGTGYGKIQIFMQARVVTQIKPEESVEVNKKASIDKQRK
jgi:hypothetical protein